MKQLIHTLCLALLACVPSLLCADLPGQPSSTINKPLSHPFQQQQQQPGQTEKYVHPQPPTSRRPVPTEEGGIPFTIPGIVGAKNGAWVGSDNLFNLKPNMNVYVELVMPENMKIEINEAQIKSLVLQIFARVGIIPIAFVAPGEAPLPLYHVLIMLNQVDECNMAFCACRLFESVTLKRVILNPGITFQAITWEKQELISAAKKDFYPLLNKTITDFTEEFIGRYQYFLNLRTQND